MRVSVPACRYPPGPPSAEPPRWRPAEAAVDKDEHGGEPTVFVSTRDFQAVPKYFVLCTLAAPTKKRGRGEEADEGREQGGGGAERGAPMPKKQQMEAPPGIDMSELD